MFNDRETCCFMRLLCRAIDDSNTYFLHVKEHENVRNGKVLLGYYDNDYVYFIPNVIIEYFNSILAQHKKKPFNMNKILENLFALNMIKAHWILTDNVRYRPQKRIGKTRRRYITFYRKAFFNFIMTEENYK